LPLGSGNRKVIPKPTMPTKATTSSAPLIADDVCVHVARGLHRHPETAVFSLPIDSLLVVSAPSFKRFAGRPHGGPK
jgi:hypothetical protein